MACILAYTSNDSVRFVAMFAHASRCRMDAAQCTVFFDSCVCKILRVDGP